MVILKNIIAFETNILSFVKFQVKLKSLKFGSTVVLFEIRTFDFLKVENIHLKPKKFGSKAPIIWVHLGCIYGQRFWKKTEKSSKIGQDKKRLMTAFDIVFFPDFS